MSHNVTGVGVSLSLTDLRLIRRAAREGWPVRPAVRRRVVRDVAAVFKEPDLPARRAIGAAWCLVEMETANRREVERERGRLRRATSRGIVDRGDDSGCLNWRGEWVCWFR